MCYFPVQCCFFYTQTKYLQMKGSSTSSIELAVATRDISVTLCWDCCTASSAATDTP